MNAIRFLRQATMLAVLALAAEGAGQQLGRIAFEAPPVDQRLEEDAGMERYIAPYRSGLEAFASEVVGKAAEPLTRSRPESGLTNLVADALLAVGSEEFDRPADFAITNFGGLRRDLPAGDITMGLLMELSPFQNYLALLEVEGELAWRIAESVARSGGIAIAGMRVERDEQGELLRAWIGEEPIDRNRIYTLVTIDYLVLTWEDLFTEDQIRSRRFSQRLVQRDAIALHLSRLAQRGVEIRDQAGGRVVERQK